MKTLKFKTFEEFTLQINSFEKVELADCLIEAIERGIKNNNKFKIHFERIKTLLLI